MQHKFMVFKILEPDSYLPHGIMEVYPCADGYRTRLVDGFYKTEEEARDRIKYYHATMVV